jgi:hypothetical protein
LAELTGVAKEVLSQDATERTRAPAPPLGVPERVPRGGSARRRRDGEIAERDLLRVMLYAPTWLERARGHVTAEWFEGAVYRSLFETLVAPGGDRFQQEQPVALPDAAQRVWSLLKQHENELDPDSVDEIYDRACETLESRPHFRELDELSARLNQAPSDEQGALLAERLQRTQELQERFPSEWKRRYLQRKLAQGSRGSLARGVTNIHDPQGA